MRLILRQQLGLALGVLSFWTGLTICCEAQSGPPFKTLDAASFQRLQDPNAQLLLEAVRQHPEVLKNRYFMTSFAILNNCVSDDPNTNGRAMVALTQSMQNEFEYPKISEFYRSHAAEILGGLPRLPLTERVKGPVLAEYDMANHDFGMSLPKTMSNPSGAFQLDFIQHNGVSDSLIRLGCGSQALLGATIRFQDLELVTLPVPADQAEIYVNKVKGGRRDTILQLELDIQNVDVDLKSTRISISARALATKATVIALVGGGHISLTNRAVSDPDTLQLAVLDAQSIAAGKSPQSGKSIRLKDLFHKQ